MAVVNRRGFAIAALLCTMVCILTAGAYFRLIGINWDQNQHQQPDERFLTMVAEQVRPVRNLSAYFDTETSSLNPLGYGFYTYGMWPLFLTRYVAEFLQKTSYDQIVLVGRSLSGLFDLAAVVLVYVLGARLYGRRAGLLASALYAAAVLAIQLSHFFAVDSFATVFILVAFYVAVLIMDGRGPWLYAAFGILTGITAATKVSLAPLYGIVVIAGLARVYEVWSNPIERRTRLKGALMGCFVAALVGIWVFRVLQPYAFTGPGFFGVRFNPRWLEIIRGVADQVAGRSDFPPNHHWAGRPFSYGWTNMVRWGLGPLLGIVATMAWGWAAWRCWKGDWRRHLLLVAWVGAYFLYQSQQFWRYTRYYLPIYPFAILLAAWALIELFDRAWARRRMGRRGAATSMLAAVLLAAVVVTTAAYAFAFTRIYTRPHSRVAASRWMYQHIPGPLNVVLETPGGRQQIPLSMPYDRVIRPGEPWTVTFSPPMSGSVTRVTVPHVSLAQTEASPSTLVLNLVQENSREGPLASATVQVGSSSGMLGTIHENAVEFPFPDTAIEAGERYFLTLNVIDGSPLTLSGAAIARESEWDDVLPLSVDGYNPYSGLYESLDLKLHERETESKREQMADVLDQADYIVIASNRGYDAMPRLPLRFPLTVAFYRALFDCESEHIASCANAAVAPFFSRLGYDLVATFESYPTLGPVSMPDQEAQESFTVYDHPRVLVFEKRRDYTPAAVRDVLNEVDLNQVIEQNALQVSQAPTGLRLSAAQRLAQRATGTWSELFSPSAWLNRSQPLAALTWYVLLFLVGWLVFPVVYVAFRGLSDRGYAVSRIIGLLTVAWLAWFGSSYRVFAFTRGTLWLCLAAITGAAALILWKHGSELVQFARSRWRYILFVETVFAVLFLFGLFLRWNNPDLWHPWRGGEKPGDLALFNAVLKTAHFPPYDPWLAGHYVNYYYFGYVLSAVPTKLLGIVPAIAYNLLIPTWFALTGLAAFGVAYNLIAARSASGSDREPPSPATPLADAGAGRAPYVAGIAALVLLLLLGNLYEVRLLWERLPEFAETPVAGSSPFQQSGDVIAGAGRVLAGDADLFRGDPGAWYFDASRAILNGKDATPITEFPYFTFLYADLHPHLMDMPIVLVALAWMLGYLRSPALLSRTRKWRELLPIAAIWLSAGLIFGTTYATNTWDFPVTAGLGVLAVGYAVWTNSKGSSRDRAGCTLLHIALLIFLSMIMFAPFRHWLATGEQTPQLWHGPRTPLSDYVVVHGLFLFLIVTFLLLETIRVLRPAFETIVDRPFGDVIRGYRSPLLLLLGFLAVAAIAVPLLWRYDLQALILALPLAIWSGVLLLVGEQTQARRVVLALILVGIGLTVAAELVTIKGDVGRMNVVFKLYLLTWLFLSIAAAGALVWVSPVMMRGEKRSIWWGVLGCLVFAAALYPVIGTIAKAQDRWPGVSDPPRTLDGMAYMLGGRAGKDEAPGSVVYQDEGRPLLLGRDYEAIRWMQDNIAGTPTIVEGHSSEYRWGSRFSVYTGLPTIVGWSWHLRQHDAVLPASMIEKRILDVHQFYNTPSRADAVDFLKRYEIDYVIVGELERAQYAGEGLGKFSQMAADGELRAVYSEQADGEGVTIYAVEHGH